MNTTGYKKRVWYRSKQNKNTVINSPKIPAWKQAVCSLWGNLMSFLSCVGVSASKLLVPFIGAGLPKWPELWRKFTRNYLVDRYFFVCCTLLLFSVCWKIVLLNISTAFSEQCFQSDITHHLYPDVCLYGQRGCQSWYQEEYSSPFSPLNYAHWTFPLRNLSEIHLV